MTKSLVLVLVACLVLSPAAALSAQKGGWGSFGVGSWSKTKTHSVSEAGPTKVETTIITKMTLKELTAKEAVLETETETSMMLGTNPVKQPTVKMVTRVPLEPEAGQPSPGASPASAPAEKGVETLTIAGKTLKCSWTKVVSDVGGSKSVAKSWICDEVPGALVKTESETSGQASAKMTMELLEFEVK